MSTADAIKNSASSFILFVVFCNVDTFLITQMLFICFAFVGSVKFMFAWACCQKSLDFTTKTAKNRITLLSKGKIWYCPYLSQFGGFYIVLWCGFGF
jgi:hypothetical protein